MPRLLAALLILCVAVGFAHAEDSPVIKFPSPDGRFALQITKPSGDTGGPQTAALIEKSSGKVLVPLGDIYGSHVNDTVLVWSADSKWAAYGTRGDKEGETDIYFWNGSSFDTIPLPETLPDPKINFGKKGEGDVKNYGGAIKPLRWLKTGELECSSDLMMLSRSNGKTYTGSVTFTLAFDTQHHATVKHVGRTKTKVED